MGELRERKVAKMEKFPVSVTTILLTKRVPT